MKVAGDRIAGAALVAAAVTIALVAMGFRVTFYTDPLGPAGLPLLAAALLGVGGALVLLRPAPSQWPGGGVVRRATLVLTSLLVYAALLPVLGFIISTGLVLVVMGRTFGGPWVRGAVLAGLYATTLYLLFSYALGLPLPIGSLLVRGP